MKQLRVFRLPPGWPWDVSPSHPMAMGAQEHNTMSPARARIRIARFEDEHTNHEATAPPLDQKTLIKQLELTAIFSFTNNPRMGHVKCSTICGVTPVWKGF